MTTPTAMIRVKHYTQNYTDDLMSLLDPPPIQTMMPVNDSKLTEFQTETARDIAALQERVEVLESRLIALSEIIKDREQH